MKTTIMLILAVIIGLASPQLYAAQAPQAMQRFPLQVMPAPATQTSASQAPVKQAQVVQVPVNIPAAKTMKIYYVTKDVQSICIKVPPYNHICQSNYDAFPKCNNDIDRPIAFSRYTDGEMAERDADPFIQTEEFVDVIGYDMSLTEPTPVTFTFSPGAKDRWIETASAATSNMEFRTLRVIRACMNFSDFLTD